ncbi:MAG: helix-turn-helix transcriptional regulator [Alistipes sp.]|nr:helix-turn-helix transcriptional regulator [Alistipes sp.]MBS6460137.1 helix-turn-helix transcriptional regulator [Alistipes sp.]
MKRTNPILVSLVAKRICDIRELHHHTQEYLSNNTRLKIWEYESGQKFPSVESIAKICKFYNITLDEFFAPMKYPVKE